MKKNDFLDIKGLNVKSLAERSRKIEEEIADLVLDKNINRLKDVKSISKKRKDLAQVLTVLKQKELLAKLESAEDKVEGVVKKGAKSA